MSDVIEIQTQPDSADCWRTALEHMISTADFGRQIVASQFANQERYACLDGEAWTITGDFDEAIRAEVLFPFPKLRTDVAWIYQAILEEDIATNCGIFARCWKSSPAAQACGDELRKQLDEYIFSMRQIFAEMAAEARQTGKLIA